MYLSPGVFAYEFKACSVIPLLKSYNHDKEDLSNSTFLFLPIHSQLDIRPANFLHKFIASENSLCYLFALTARRKLNELFVQFDNVTTACQFHDAILDSLTCTNDFFELRGNCKYYL